MIAKFNDQEGIVNVTDFFEANNTAYIVMEYLDGITLKEYIAENGVLSSGRYFRINGTGIRIS